MTLDLMEIDDCLACRVIPGDIVRFTVTDEDGVVSDELLRVEVVGTNDSMVLLTGISDLLEHGSRMTYELDPEQVVVVVQYA